MIRIRHQTRDGISVDSTRDPVLNIWEVISLIGETEMFPETDEISQIFAEAEIILFQLILRIINTRKIRDQPRLRLVSSSADITR
jgi:hypothetical protein